MATVKSNEQQSSSTAGLRMVGGAAAGAAAGSLVGPLGAAVGAVVGGIAGANASGIAESKPMKKVAAAATKTARKVMKGASPTKALSKVPGVKSLMKKTTASSPANKRSAPKSAKAKKRK